MKTEPAKHARPDGSPQDWWRGAAIYEVNIRSFRDASGDGVGDLRGIVEKLDYIADLGVDAIWVTPFAKSPMRDFGYDVSDYYAVDPIYGVVDDLKFLLDGAHQRGLKVMTDQVFSHTSNQHPWFLESRASVENPKADWYVWGGSEAGRFAVTTRPEICDASSIQARSQAN